MILGTPDTVPAEHTTGYHGGQGSFSRRTLLQNIPNSTFKYVRDVIIPTGSFVGEHHHADDEEVFFIISGQGVMNVDGEEKLIGPGSAVLTLSGSTHSIRNDGPEELRFFVACVKGLI
jgi:mannose-6-phosphate isomerase-like protein (cupin superfamily)